MEPVPRKAWTVLLTVRNTFVDVEYPGVQPEPAPLPRSSSAPCLPYGAAKELATVCLVVSPQRVTSQQCEGSEQKARPPPHQGRMHRPCKEKRDRLRKLTQRLASERVFGPTEECPKVIFPPSVLQDGRLHQKIMRDVDDLVERLRPSEATGRDECERLATEEEKAV